MTPSNMNTFLRRALMAAIQRHPSLSSPRHFAHARMLLLILLVQTVLASISVTEPVQAAEPTAAAEPAPAAVPATPPKPSAPASEETLSDDCFDELEHGAAGLIACRVPLTLSPTEQDELEKGSRGYVKNVSCMLTIKIERGDLEIPLAAPAHVFESPQQPVTCTVTTYKTTFDVAATFAPRVTFKDGTAVKATPGLANVSGVSRVISWPVVQFVNRWPSIQNGMLQVVNAYLARKRERRQGHPSP